MKSITKAINIEIQAVFKMLKDATSRIEGDFWKKSENKWMYGYTLFHAIEAIEYYMSDSPEEWVHLSEVSANSEEKETETLKKKDRQFFENYLLKVESKTFEVLGKLNDKDLLEKDGFSKRGFASRLHKFSYVIRHAMVHVGELSKTLRSLGMKSIKWE
ncbi:MAG: hypothetical protein KAU62_00330 [Candidatus Heimdallarchaeota archaeon]|nr:hypothetical protein [Candidatus Heimdallarchaeota archaeon]MCG3254492.1 hypothetical protein [Candidatus Heimdallarchaeota archaeon]MCK4609577.1 hypothetical protein [Candidatus Heimdallarchaeota archaeon]